MPRTAQQHSICSHTKQSQIRRNLLSAGIVFLLFCITVQAASAHGEGGIQQVFGEMAGPYTLDAWTNPAILRTGEIHVETAVSRGGMAAPNCDVEVRIVSIDSGDAIQTVRATGADAATNFRHEAAFQLAIPGRYRIDVMVHDPMGRGGEATFEIEVIRIPAWIKFSIYVALSLSVAMGIWILYQGVQLMRSSIAPRHATPIQMARMQNI